MENKYVFLGRINSSGKYSSPLCWKVEIVKNGETISTHFFGLKETAECRKWIQRFVPYKLDVIPWQQSDFYGREFEVIEETEAWGIL